MVIRQSTPAITRGVARIVMVVGGTFQSLAELAQTACADVVLWLDVASELDNAEPATGVLKLVLAPGQTLDDLIETAPDSEQTRKVREFLKSRPGVDVTIGLARYRAGGYIAAAQLVNSPEFKEFARWSVFAPLLITHNGLIDKAEIELLASGAGGTGGPVGAPVAEAISIYFREYFRAVNHVEFTRVGALTFESLGADMVENTVATLVGDLNRLVSLERHASEVRSLNLLELPMTGENGTARQSYAVQVVQAKNAPGFRALRNMWAPNNAIRSEFGTVDIYSPSFWHEIPPTAILSDVAAAYDGQLASLSAAEPLPGFVDAIDVEFEEGTSRAQWGTIEDIQKSIRNAAGVKPEGLYEECAQVEFHFRSVRVVAHLNGAIADIPSGRLDVTDGFDARTFGSPGEWKVYLSKVRALQQHASGAIRDRRAEIEKLQSRCKRMGKVIAEAEKRDFPRGIRQRVAAMVANPKKHTASFRNALTHARKANHEIARLEAEVTALRQAVLSLESAFNTQLDQLRDVRRLLATVAPSQTGDNPHVVVQELDMTLIGRMIELSRFDGVEDEVTRLLIGCAGQVTWEGLARITGAAKATPEAVAEQLAREVPPVESPPWGARRTLTCDHRVVVLPPVSEKTRKAVQEHVNLLQKDPTNRLQIVAAASAEAGVNIVQFEIHHPKRLDSIIPPYYRKHQETAEQSPHHYFPEGLEGNRFALNGSQYASSQL